MENYRHTPRAVDGGYSDCTDTGGHTKSPSAPTSPGIDPIHFFFVRVAAVTRSHATLSALFHNEETTAEMWALESADVSQAGIRRGFVKKDKETAAEM